MAKRVFFSFHYDDVADFRANVVRQSWMTKADREAAGFFDASIWERARKESRLALKRLINAGLERTSVTCVLIGSDTYQREWVRYEIMKSLSRGNKLLGVHINSIADKFGNVKPAGPDPFEYLAVRFSDSGMTATLLEWVGGVWVEYGEVGGASYRLRSPVSVEWRGKGHKLRSFARTYDWKKDGGYQNFASWVA